jgi:hypothetical protein
VPGMEREIEVEDMEHSMCEGMHEFLRVVMYMSNI